jgi:hypothetical protein
MIAIKPFDGAKITQTFLDATRVIKSFRICKNSLTSFLAGLKMSPVDSLLLKVGKIAFTPGIVSRFTYSGKALEDTILLQ